MSQHSQLNIFVYQQQSTPVVLLGQLTLLLLHTSFYGGSTLIFWKTKRTCNCFEFFCHLGGQILSLRAVCPNNGMVASAWEFSRAHSCSWGAGIACWLKRWTRDRKVASSNPGRSGVRIFFSRVNFVCWLLLGVRSTPRVTAVARFFVFF